MSSSSAKAERLFLALWPDEGVREAIAAAAREVLRQARGRPVPRANLHMTLVFLGATPPQARETLLRHLAHVRAAAFRLELDRIGTFSRSRVLWIAPSRPPEALHRLVAALAAAAAAAGGPPERRPFVPHVTLARKARPVVVHTLGEPVSWPVRRFWLVRSHTLPAGAEYLPLRSWPLGTEAAVDTAGGGCCTGFRNEPIE